MPGLPLLGELPRQVEGVCEDFVFFLLVEWC